VDAVPPASSPPTLAWPRLSRTPVVEGLIDIRVERSSTVTFDALKAASDDLAQEFPSRLGRLGFVAQIGLSQDAEPRVSATMAEPNAIIMRSAEEGWVAQFGLDGMTVSRLQPYTGWTELRSKAMALWGAYRAAARPERIVRVAVRFINRIPIPPGEPIEGTFSTTFLIAPGLPQTVAGFLLRMVVTFEAHDAAAIVTQSLEDAGGPDCMFDLDTFSVIPDGFSEADLWEKLDTLRGIKNDLFFGSLTPQALRRFQ